MSTANKPPLSSINRAERDRDHTERKGGGGSRTDEKGRGGTRSHPEREAKRPGASRSVPA